MKRRVLSVFVAIILVLLMPFTTYAHPGRTDANGGHYNRKTGEYHYHNGGGARHSSGGSSNSYKSKSKSKPKQTKKYAKRVTISNSVKSIDVGESVELKASVYPTDSEDNKIKWKSSDEKVVKISGSKMTAVGTGKATVTAETSKGTSSKFVVEVKEVEAKSIAIRNENATIIIGEVQDLIVDFIPENTTNQDLLWSSSDDSVVSVDKNGIITANQIGKAVITVMHKGLKDSIDVEVLPVKADSISIIFPDSLELNETSNNPKIEVNSTYVLKADISPFNATDTTIKWSVSDKSKAKIDENGTFTALKSGVVTITAETENGKTDTLNIEIYGSDDSAVGITALIIVAAVVGIVIYVKRKKKHK